MRAVNIKVKLSISLECIFSPHLLSKPKSDSKCTEQVGFLSLKDKNIWNKIIKLKITGKRREWDWIVRMVTVHQVPKHFRQSNSLLGSDKMGFLSKEMRVRDYARDRRSLLGAYTIKLYHTDT